MQGQPLAPERGSEDLWPEEVVEGLAATNETGLVTFDKDLGGADASVVVRAEAHAVGTGVEQGDEVASAELLDLAVASEEVAALADGTDDIRDLERAVLAERRG